MSAEKLKRIIENSFKPDADVKGLAEYLKANGVTYSFSPGFTERVSERIFSAGAAALRNREMFYSLSSVFNRVAFAGAAAILLLLISIFIMEGTITFNSLVGISESFDETLISLLLTQ